MGRASVLIVVLLCSFDVSGVYSAWEAELVRLYDVFECVVGAFPHLFHSVGEKLGEELGVLCGHFVDDFLHFARRCLVREIRIFEND